MVPPGWVRAADDELHGERRPVTIMFADIVGSTTLAERLDPEEWREILVGAHRLVGEAVHRYEGTIAQLLGDGVLAFFGAPVMHEDDPLRAVRAALDLQGSLEPYAATLAPSIPAMRMRVGIDMGTVVVGQIAHDRQVEYTATGDAMNRAARLQAAAAPGAVLVSDAIFQTIRHAVIAVDLAPIAIKGSQWPERAHEVRGLDAAGRGGRPGASVRAALVGRAAELEKLAALTSAVRAGAGRLAVVIGEPGVGKSRLINEWRRNAGPGIHWVEAECLSYGEGLPYHLVITLVRSLIGCTAAATEAETAAAVAALAGRLPEPDGDEARAFLSHLLSLRLLGPDLEAVQGVNPQGFQVRYTEALRGILVAIAAEGPVTLVLEDMHWADPASAAVLARLLPLVTSAPLLLCFVTRPDHSTPGWGLVTAARDQLGAGLNELWLAPLSTPEVVTLTASLVGFGDLPADLQSVILERAEGNPLFVEEIVSALFEQGALRRDAEGQLEPIDGGAATDIPDTLNRLLLARIDRLADEPKRTLRVASVLGREFLAGILDDVLAGIGQAQSQAALLSQLGALEYSNLIELMVGRPELGYLFRHALVREAAYAAVLKADRRMLHRAVAEALETTYPDRLDELGATLAYHFERAEARDRALYYLVRAADQARERFANAEAIALYRAALAHADAAADDGAADVAREGPSIAGPSIDLRERLGGVLTLTGRHEEARGVFGSALRRLPAGAVIDRARLQRLVGDAWMEPRQMEQVFASFAAAQELLVGPIAEAAPGWRAEWLALQLSRLWAMYWANDVADMDALAQEVGPVVAKIGTPVQEARYHILLVLEALRRSRFLPGEEALERAGTALAAARASGELTEIAFAEFVLGFCHLWRNELDDGEPHIGIALEIAERIGDTGRRIMSLTYLAVIRRRRRDVAGVRDLLPRCLAAADDVKIGLYAAVAQANEAWVAYQGGDRAGAEAIARPALEALCDARFPGASLASWPLLAVALDRDDMEVALDAARIMLEPWQFRQPDSIERSLAQAVRRADAGDVRRGARDELATALGVALNSGYF